MKFAWIAVLALSPCAYAQESGNVIFQAPAPGPGTVAIGGMAMKGGNSLVQGAPYSATITNESVQTLADGNRIVTTTTGTIARDSMGRTRHDATLPAIGNLSPATAPHLVFIQDPVAQVSYTLNLTDKTAQKMPMPSAVAGSAPGIAAGGMTTEPAGGTFFVQMATAVPVGAGAPAGSLPLPPPATMSVQKIAPAGEPSQTSTEDLGTQTIEGVLAAGLRTTRTIPAGQIGNEKPLVIVTEVWTSPDLKTIVSSKRSDPRMGEQTFQLTNVVRAEPDATLFTVPSDFKVIDGPAHIVYHTNR
jgi:hypothetical protein